MVRWSQREHADRAMGEILKHLASEVRTEELRAQIRKGSFSFLSHREVSAQEMCTVCFPYQ